LRRRGLTLAELIVVIGLLGLLLTLCVQVLNPSIRVWELNRARADLDQAAMVSSGRIQRDLLATRRDAISFRASTPCVLAYPVSTRYEPLTGKPIFDRWALYSLDPSNRVLYRREWAVTATTDPQPLLDPQLSLMAVTPPLQRVTGHVAAMRVPNLATPDAPVRVELDYRRPGKGADEVTFRVLELNPRNNAQ
jgi:hypothetical protein